MVTEAQLIRQASSAWLRENEGQARAFLEGKALDEERTQEWWLRFFYPDWSDWQVSNMLSYLAMVDEAP